MSLTFLIVAIAIVTISAVAGIIIGILDCKRKKK